MPSPQKRPVARSSRSSAPSGHKPSQNQRQQRKTGSTSAPVGKSSCASGEWFKAPSKAPSEEKSKELKQPVRSRSAGDANRTQPIAKSLHLNVNVAGPEEPKRLRKASNECYDTCSTRAVHQQSSLLSLSSPAAFANGMRISHGRGRMNQDYIGVVLPLRKEFSNAGSGLFGAPWLTNINPFYQECSDGTTRLSYELIDLVNYLRRGPDEQLARTTVSDEIMAAVRAFFAQEVQEVKLYGSEATELGLPLSDIDIAIIAPRMTDPKNPYNDQDLKVEALQKLGKHLETIEIAETSTVREGNHPLLELKEARCDLDIDITFEGASATRSLLQVDQWRKAYPKEFERLVLLLKHALGMRQLGLASATTPYEGGVGSYIIMCMVVGYLELYRKGFRRADNQRKNFGWLFLDMLKFWGLEFDYESQGLALNPPTIFPKTPDMKPWVFDVRLSPDDPVNLAASTFGTRHIKETLKHFYDILVQGVAEFDTWRRTLSAAERLGISMHGRTSPGPAPAPAQDFGILGPVMAGKYCKYERSRLKIRLVPRWRSTGSLPP